MIRIGQVMMVAAAVVAPVSAQAADWWFIAGEPEDHVLFFADAETVVRHSAHVTLRVQRIEKSDRVIETVTHVQCSPSRRAQEEIPLRRFACSTEEERMHLGIMLGDKTPRQAAGMIFAMRTGNSGP